MDSDFDSPEYNEEDEFLVGVSFYAKDFALTVVWNTDPSVSDETRVAAAADWFASEYGFDPRPHVLRTSVQPLPTDSNNPIDSKNPTVS